MVIPTLIRRLCGWCCASSFAAFVHIADERRFGLDQEVRAGLFRIATHQNAATVTFAMMVLGISPPLCPEMTRPGGATPTRPAARRVRKLILSHAARNR